MESILNTIKKMLGISIEDDNFDTDIIVHINSVIPSLSQMGIGPKNGIIVTGQEQLWSQFIDSSVINLESVKTYIYLKVKLIFDPPQNSTTIKAFEDSIAEFEWRMMLAIESNNLEV
jgi:hypothetical protein